MATAPDPQVSRDSDAKPRQDDQSHTNVRCPVCLDFYEAPKLLPCGHLVCRKCLKNWLEAHGMPRTCPECRSEIVGERICRLPPSMTPDEVCDALLTDLAMEVLVEASRTLLGPHVCEKCGRKADNLCLTCYHKLCQKCRRQHAQAVDKVVAEAEAEREAAVAKAGTAELGLDADHPSIPYVAPLRHLMEPLSALTPTVVCRNRVEWCTTHQGPHSWRAYVCETHDDKSMCVHCVREDHSGCQVATTRSKVEEGRRELAEQKERLEQRDQVLKQQVKLLDQKAEEAKRTRETMQAELDAVMDGLSARLQSAKEKLIHDIALTETLPADQKLARQSSLLQEFHTNMKEMLALKDAEAIINRYEEYSQQTVQEVEEQGNAVLGPQPQCPESCVHNSRHRRRHRRRHRQRNPNQHQQAADNSALHSVTQHLATELDAAMESLGLSILSEDAGTADSGNTDAPSSDSADKGGSNNNASTD